VCNIYAAAHVRKRTYYREITYDIICIIIIIDNIGTIIITFIIIIILYGYAWAAQWRITTLLRYGVTSASDQRENTTPNGMYTEQSVTV